MGSYLSYRQLMKLPFYFIMKFTHDKVLEGIQKFQIIATIKYIIIWNENVIYIFNN